MLLLMCRVDWCYVVQLGRSKRERESLDGEAHIDHAPVYTQVHPQLLQYSLFSLLIFLLRLSCITDFVLPPPSPLIPSLSLILIPCELFLAGYGPPRTKAAGGYSSAPATLVPGRDLVFLSGRRLLFFLCFWTWCLFSRSCHFSERARPLGLTIFLRTGQLILAARAEPLGCLIV